MSAETALMPIAGMNEPLPVPRGSEALSRPDGRVELVGLSKDKIRAALEASGLDARQAKLRSKQLWHWIYNRGATGFAAMTDIAKAQRPWLEERFVISRPDVVTAQVSSDGTRKWLLKTQDGNEFEMVFIPDADRGTLCVSSQVGCTLNCRFCHTGTMKLVRNLEPSEIVGQVMLARDSLGEWPSQPEGRMLTNIVMMGMGEPLYNFDNVRDALKIVMDGDGLGLSRRRITLSTSGVVPMMARAGITWPTISDGSRLRTSRIVPVWQKRQLSVQPTWLETHRVPRSASGMNTISKSLPSRVRSSHLRVLSDETCASTTSGRAMTKCCSSHGRCALAISVIGEKSVAPRL